MAFVSWEEKSIEVPRMLFHVNMSYFCITTLMSHKVAQELAASETPWNQNQITQKDVEARFCIKALPPAFPLLCRDSYVHAMAVSWDHHCT